MKNLFILFSIIFSLNSYSQEQIAVVAVGQAEEEKETVAIFPQNINTTAASNYQKTDLEKIHKIISNDLNFYRHKYNVKNISNLKTNLEPEMENWKQQNYRFVVLTNITPGATAQFHVKVFDVLNSKEVANIVEVYAGNLRAFAHMMADAIYQAMASKKSIFNSKIFFVSDKLSRGSKVIKELYQMDFDGENVERLTFHQSIVISPAISPENNRILYSVIKMKNKIQNVDLYMLDLKTKEHKLVSSRAGINSGGVFSGDGEKIYLTLSYTGNADIYELNLKTQALRKITNHFADDVDPSITADGNIMSFLSGRPGVAMIYTLNPHGEESQVKRISYVGKFNATPRFNPEGKEIVFSSWVDNRFDIYRIAADGSNIVRLTKDFGSNEEPSYSNDGEFVAFASQRVLSRKEAIQNLYIMTRDGEILGNLTDNFGHCTSPRWSN